MEEYGNWGAVLIGIIFFSFFTLSFLLPKKKIEWRSLGIFEAFLVALFAEMYGFALTIYILSSFFGIPLSFVWVEGHLFAKMLSFAMNFESALILVHTASSLLIFGGLILMGSGWKKIYFSNGALVKEGIYRLIRHPQYAGILLLAIGLLILWPTLITLAMFPVLALMYYRLARKEEAELEEKFGEEYINYKRTVPMFIPVIKRSDPHG